MLWFIYYESMRVFYEGNDNVRCIIFCFYFVGFFVYILFSFFYKSCVFYCGFIYYLIIFGK